MYSLIRVWIGLKLARIAIQLSSVVSTTSATDRPSAPSLKLIPKAGIHGGLDHELEAGPAGQVADQQQQRHDERGQREPECQRPGIDGRGDGDQQRADQRQERDDGQDRDVVDVHQRPASSRYEPAITISPTAIPSA